MTSGIINGCESCAPKDRLSKYFEKSSSKYSDATPSTLFPLERPLGHIEPRQDIGKKIVKKMWFDKVFLTKNIIFLGVFN
jgi:hypothetical protein